MQYAQIIIIELFFLEGGVSFLNILTAPVASRDVNKSVNKNIRCSWVLNCKVVNYMI